MSSGIYKNTCPDCGHPIRVRNSRGLSQLVRVCYLQCTNVGCGATFRANFEFTHRMSPPAVPNASIHLPMADYVMLREASKNADDDQLDFDALLNLDHPLHSTEIGQEGQQ